MAQQSEAKIKIKAITLNESFNKKKNKFKFKFKQNEMQLKETSEPRSSIKLLSQFSYLVSIILSQFSKHYFKSSLKVIKIKLRISKIEKTMKKKIMN